MKKLLLCTLLLGATGSLFAQKIKITGFVLDSTANKPVEFATVALLKDNTPIEGTTADERGKFTLTKATKGNYQVKITFVGYRDKIINNVKTENEDLDLGVIKIGQSAQQLQEVTVVEQKALFEEKPDRLVYNAEKDITIKGGNAGDVLRKIPSIAVDMDGNVELRGSANIKVLINNKPSNLMARSIADVLKQIPADDIKQIEVITSPSAKYDAEGTAGIINIITKKNSIQGINGNADLSVGRWNDRMNGSVNYRQKAIGISARGGFNRWRNQGGNESNRVTNVEGVSSALFQTTTFRGDGENGYGTISADWDIDSLNRMSASLNLYDGKNGMNFDYLNDYSTQGVTNQYFTRNLYRIYDWQGNTLNLDYTKTFKKPRREFNVLTMFSKEGEDSFYKLDQANENKAINYREKSTNYSANYEGTVQLDFTNPLDSVSTMEIGVKSIFRNVKSDYQVANAIDGSTNFENVPALANVFEYAQQVASSYLTYSRTSKNKWGINAGVRYEHTFINAEFLAGKVPFSNNYGNIIPNISLSRSLPKNQKLKISYTQRIQRPMLWYLNPYVNASEPLMTYTGNPYLKPELTHSAEINYNVYIKESSINTSLFMRTTNNAIERIRTFDQEGVATLAFQNIAQNTSYGLTLSGNTKIKKFTANGAVNVYYNILNSPALQAKNENLMYRFNVNSSYDFGKGFKAQFFGFFNSPRVMLQGKVSGFAYYNVGFQKEIMNKKATVGLGFDNFLAPYFTQNGEFSGPTFTQTTKSRYYNQGWRLSFSYQFGKMTSQPQRSKKSISNDDKKSGD
ncbi:TonB-dependent receptor domain-containing protein [Emticicia sp. 21SJ11W-3]|uniref:TonB-dependent receptor domain-containing protein n=1 Tax=Emticicia sp. 21SJ11W-3 TaxID=2916755 RepID=UPI00209FDBEA|nr:TonB-dependent receptor [Emticicia sp. 21SJ11W-3]UTA69925.1 TonB-dependent receptor [Emticicia sp. 21SJ11W-3]